MLYSEDEILKHPLYQNVLYELEKAGKHIGINRNVMERLKLPRRSIRVSIPVRMDDDHVQVFNGYRVQHNHTLGPFKGGIRYHPTVNIGEIAALASLMTYKNSLLNLPLGGAKGGVQLDPSVLSKGELEALTRRFISELSPFIGPDKDIPAPDVGTDSETMAWMLDTYSLESGFSQTGVVTGKPIEIGGSKGRSSATGLGVVYILEKALEAQNKNISEATIAVQGFGKVGLHACVEAHALGARVVAVSDHSGGLFNPKGLNVTDLINYGTENRFIKGYPKAETISNKELLTLEVDALLPCALDGVINTDNMKQLRTPLIVEGANGPTTPEASEYLVNHDVLITPDILANGGGVIVSYFEWVQDIGWLFWTEKQVRDKLRDIMFLSFDKVWNFAEEYPNKGKGKYKDLRMAGRNGGISYAPGKGYETERAGLVSFYPGQETERAGLVSFYPGQETEKAGLVSFYPGQETERAGLVSFYPGQETERAGLVSFYPGQETERAGLVSFYPGQETERAGLVSFYQAKTKK